MRASRASGDRPFRPTKRSSRRGAPTFSLETVFSRQIQALGRPGDIAWGISTSENCPDVVEGLKVARERELSTIGLTGQGGGRMAQWCDVLMAVPLMETPPIQEIHLVTYHAICATVEERLVVGAGVLVSRNH